jgi:hypothetical protein
MILVISMWVESTIEEAVSNAGVASFGGQIVVGAIHHSEDVRKAIQQR